MPIQADMLRSNFLVHWTGRDIECKHSKCADKNVRATTYVDRLSSTLKHGLWMTKNTIDKLYVPQTCSPDLSYQWPMTSFTEIKLSQTQVHTKNYGCLGFGFTREFVMDRNGAPVQYVPGNKNDIIADHAYKLRIVLNFLHEWVEKNDPCGSSIPFLSNLKKFLACKDYIGNANAPWDIFKDLRSSINTNILFMKPMSTLECPKDFRNLEELEWRIPWLTCGKRRKRQEDLGVNYCVKKQRYPKTLLFSVEVEVQNDLNNENISEKLQQAFKNNCISLSDDAAVSVKEIDTKWLVTDAGKTYTVKKQKDKLNVYLKTTPGALIPFTAVDLKVLIFPDNKTRKEAFKNKCILEWFGSPRNYPIMATVKECMQF